MTEIEILKEVYAALNRNDLPGVFKFFDPEIVRIEWEGFPAEGRYKGLSEVQAHFVQGRSTWAEGGCEPERFSVDGDMFVRVKLKDKFEWVEGRTEDTFTFKNGKIIEMRTSAA